MEFRPVAPIAFDAAFRTVFASCASAQAGSRVAMSVATTRLFHMATLRPRAQSIVDLPPEGGSHIDVGCRVFSCPAEPDPIVAGKILIATPLAHRSLNACGRPLGGYVMKPSATACLVFALLMPAIVSAGQIYGTIVHEG